MEKVLQFANFLRDVGIIQSKQDKILNWFILYLQDTQVQEFNKKIQNLELSEEAYKNLQEDYFDQIISMFINHENLTVPTYKNYLNLVFTNLYKKKHEVTVQS